MRHYPDLNSEYNKKELEVLNIEKWQLDLLKLNPNYLAWGCYEDYMCSDDAGWRTRSILNDFSEMWKLDDLNECVNFYFELYRENHQCPECEGHRLNKKTIELYNTWYKHLNDQNYSWADKLEKEEIYALMKSGRLDKSLTNNIRCYFDNDKKEWRGWKNGQNIKIKEPEIPDDLKVNSFYKKGFGHDSLNCWICVKARAKKLGVYGKCGNCIDGYIYDEEKGKAALQLWILHPRKGCSKGVYIKEIKKEDLNNVFKYLLEAKKRNNKRFSKIKLLKGDLK